LQEVFRPLIAEFQAHAGDRAVIARGADCKTFTPAIGMTFGYRFSHYFYLENETTFFSGSGSYAKKGSAKEGLIGIRAGDQFRKWGVFGSIRPG